MPALSDIVKEAWQQEPRKRPSFSDIVHKLNTLRDDIHRIQDTQEPRHHVTSPSPALHAAASNGDVTTRFRDLEESSSEVNTSIRPFERSQDNDELGESCVCGARISPAFAK